MAHTKHSWANTAWPFIIDIAANYDPERRGARVATRRFFQEVLPGLIPCLICASNYRGHLKQHPVERALTSSERLLAWIHQLRNSIRRDNHQPTESIATFRARVRNLIGG